MMSGSIFLSASVPVYGREFFDTCRPYQIHTAVRSFLLLALGRRHIVFGGHPSITPMVHSACESLGVTNIDCVTIYQSQYFEEKFPLENKEFANFRLIPAEIDAVTSVAAMRQCLIEENSFSAGVFIGGMNGIINEYNSFRKYFPEASTTAVRFAGGAAETLPPSSNKDIEINHLEHSNDYLSLFSQALNIDLNEERRFTT